MSCAHCGTENEAGRKFCKECGRPLAFACPSCGAANTPDSKFCGECGALLTTVASDAPTAGAPVPPRPAPVSERRLVSVLFADLVGFTPLSEARDPEEVRDILSRYFDTCRVLISRYGGVVEKFIGDAVMAVWGTPIAREDDAERAVRAALDLVDAVVALGREVGAPDLRARAGLLTGEAAVNLAAVGEGMVAGDMVNTASRIQAAARPGTVYVGESTRRATEVAIAYEDAGEHELKGKAEPVHLWHAARVVGTRRGTMLPSGLEPPFVGRDRELRLIKELFHVSAEERRAHLVSVVGVGGIGKSRLSWEFEKYVDGLLEDIWWHRGRCLAYGDGVAFWALAEMVRGRAGILEDEESVSARAKLRASLDEVVPDPDERRFVEPRLAQLLGLEDRVGDQENLFSAWRIFFERMADSGPSVMVFEDIHWADSALLDFIEYLLEWSRDLPMFVLTLSRPELDDRRPTWGAGKRNFTSLFLEPLGSGPMDTLLRGPVPGLPDELRDRILERAEGVPFYAVETVRMLMDRGLLVRDGSSFRVTGPIETLEVPETLQALIAARLDGLTEDERRLLQKASVLGRTFTVPGLSAVTGLPEAELRPRLDSLVHKDVLSISADPGSPERGQYGFLQDLVKKVAYDTMSRKDRRAHHIAAAEFLERGFGSEEDEIIEVVAAHYLDAYHSAPDAPDAGEIRDRARDRLIRAADRASSLGARLEAQRHFERAAELTDDPMVQAELLEGAGMMANAGARAEDASVLFTRAMELFEAQGATHPAARVSARLAEDLWDRGRLEEGLANMDRAFEVLSDEKPDEDLAWLAAQLGHFRYFEGHTEAAAERVEAALGIAEELGLPEILSQALNTKSLILVTSGRPLEAEVILRYALRVALENDKPTAALRAHNNLIDMATGEDRYIEAVEHRERGLALARQVGNRRWEHNFLGYFYPLYAVGRWGDALESIEALPTDEQEQRAAFNQGYVAFSTALHVHRGELDEAEAVVAQFAEFQRSPDWQERAEHACARAWLALGRGDAEQAFREAQPMLDVRDPLGLRHHAMKEALIVGIDGAITCADLDAAETILGRIAALSPARRPQFLEAHALRLGARVAAARGDEDSVEPGFRASVGRFREIGLPFWLAVTLLEQGEWLAGRGRLEDAVPLLDEARSIFEPLEAALWLRRIDAASGVETAPLRS